MTPLDQVTEIIKLLSPEDTNQTDAVYLVTKSLQKYQALLEKKTNQIELLEAEMVELKKNLKDMINQKLEAQNQLKMAKLSLKGNAKEEKETVVQHETTKPKGQTL